jgi:sugar phosphate isomerase/epimerase
MYVAIRDVTLLQAGFRTIRGGLRALNLDAVELCFCRDRSLPWPSGRALDRAEPLTTPAALRAMAEAYESELLHVCGLMVATNLNAEDLAAEVAWVRDAMVAAQALGAGVVRLDAAMTGQQQLPLCQRVDAYARALVQILEATEDIAVPLAIETHGTQGTDVQWLEGVLERVDSRRVGVALDAANFYLAGMPLSRVYEVVERLAPRVLHVHCKNLKLDPEQREVVRQPGWGYGEYVCPLPDGDLDHRRLVELLRGAGYGGALAIEDESMGKYGATERIQNLARAADYLAELAIAAGGSRLYRGPCCG